MIFIVGWKQRRHFLCHALKNPLEHEIAVKPTMGTVYDRRSSESITLSVLRLKAYRKKKQSGSPCTWRARKRRIGSFSLRQAEEERRISRGIHMSKKPSRTPSKQSDAPRRRPRIRSQVQCVFQDPGQRGVPSPSTAFRRSTISRLNQRRRHQRRRWRMSLQNPLGEHLDSFRLLTHSCQKGELLEA